MTDKLTQSMRELSRALDAGETSAEALAEEAISRHKLFGEDLHAYKDFDADYARRQARAADAARRSGHPGGPLFGMPVSAKDLYGVEGYPTYAGSPVALPPEWTREGFLIRGLRGQFATVMGKAHTVEFAFGGLGLNPHWGTPVNPWDAETRRAPGGSSCGAGVSLGEGSALIALGSDTAGSIRIPAALTGTVGHKITYGRWPVNGVVPLSQTLDSVGALTRSVADSAWFFAALDPAHGDSERFLSRVEARGVEGLRIGIPKSGAWDEAQSDIAESVRAALRELEKAGAKLVDLEFPEFDEAHQFYLEAGILPIELGAFLERELPEWLASLDEIIASRVRDKAATTARDYLTILDRRKALIARAAPRLSGVDIVATPGTPNTPPPLEEFEKDVEAYIRLNRPTSRATNPVNILDLCAIAFPAGKDRIGMPTSLQFIAPNGADEALLTAALAAERILGTPAERLGTPPRVARR
ncbi:MAG: amidase [Proteobacteria bacterium]|nr:amidase [Pseudomonadota bacterium]